MVKIKNRLLAYTAITSALLLGSVRAAELDANMAKMQAMDKITGRVSVIDVPVNGEVTFGSFSIVIRACKTRPPEETPENFAFVDVVDNYNTENPVNIFKGWMLSSTPALNAVEHPIYDVWLLKCYNGNSNRKILTQNELEQRDAIIKNKSEQVDIEIQTDTSIQVEGPKNIIPEVVENNSEASADKENTDNSIKAPQLPIAEVQLPPTMDNYEEGGPQSLLNLAVQPEVAQPPAEATDDIMSEVEKELQSMDEASNQGVLVSETMPENIPAALPLVPETPSPLMLQNEEVDTIQEVTSTPENEDTSNQLIQFEDEIEEESFDLNVDALKQ